ncbi:MAG: protease modulator HflC [Gammaproteobacteria bacterium]|nr:protease modulator HflC [Gammaproteobacteria bacterium]
MNKLIPVIIIAVLAAISLSAFFVDEREKAILLKFGSIERSDYKPGLHWKVPFVNNVRKFDSRILTMDQRPERFLTAEKKYLIVDSFIKWRIQDVEKYFLATSGDERRAGLLLYQIVNNGLRDEFGKRTIQEVITGDRAEIMGIMTQLAGDKTESLGVEIVDVRIKRIDYPEKISESVYQRMRTERERDAREFRSEGREAAERVTADADKQSKVILAEAYRDAEKLRGDGDAKAANIYASSFSKDREFYRFYRSLEAYKETFREKSDVMLIQPDSEFFRYLKNSDGKVNK